MTSWKTADLYDRLGEALEVAEPRFRDFGGLRAFDGAIATVKVYEDNSLVRKRLEEPGRGRVLVVDGAGSLRTALLGDLLGKLAVDNGWSGLIIHGCVRDAEALARLPLGVRALGTSPRKSGKRGMGEVDVALRFAGAVFRPGEHLYADEDGVVVAREAVTP